MRALVTGGNRYIGLHLIFELAAAGPRRNGRQQSSSPTCRDGCRRIHADRTQPGALLDALAPHRDEFDIVFDNTAYTRARPRADDRAVRTDGSQQFVFTSSVAVYKRSFVQPVREDNARHRPGDPDPRKAYGVGKVECEDHLLRLHAADRASRRPRCA